MISFINFQLPLSGSLIAERDGLTTTAVLGLSTPSLGITLGGPAESGEGRPGSFQLPLSGSLGITPRPRDGAGSLINLSTPSLGITCWAGLRRRQCVHKLSTPSLGITSSPQSIRTRRTGGSFQLPLSGSPAVSGTPKGLTAGNDFQLPLSGSLGFRRNRYQQAETPTFNSLSRDHLVLMTRHLEE